ncbi:hypothetical protein FE782_01925 [Paenibacillus antri]|uniref:Radical SAM protein n=1 Tax=Paenibacillus antri TaxID=2582848 RepID=A0A5R9GKR2_9BACL|nr:hypothetical protein [Paenibacillus antri]TLS54128.1 hypothetical protein FE782_01925 [Paenibacillus antri]
MAVRDLAKQKIIDNTSYKARTYGMPMDEASKNLRLVLKEWEPDHIVINTLTSYWYETLRTLIPYLKTLIPGVKISIIGPYAAIETEHAQRIGATFLVTDFIDLKSCLPDFEIYYKAITRKLNSEKLPQFGGVKFSLDPVPGLLEQVNVLKRNNIKDVVIFEGNLFVNNGEILKEFIRELKKQEIQLSLYGLCGVEIKDAPPGIFQDMYEAGFRSFFLEYEKEGNDLAIDHYLRVYRELKRYKISSGNLAGFLMIGTQDDDLETMFRHSFQLLQLCGSLIPKPYTPSFNTDEYKSYSKAGKLDLLSPHVFPLSEKNGISREEYKEFYQHTSFLNEKRLGQSFNFFDDHYCSIALKRSLGKKG